MSPELTIAQTLQSDISVFLVSRMPTKVSFHLNVMRNMEFYSGSGQPLSFPREYPCNLLFQRHPQHWCDTCALFETPSPMAWLSFHSQRVLRTTPIAHNRHGENSEMWQHGKSDSTAIRRSSSDV